MTKESQSGQFGGLNIESIEQGLGLVLPDLGGSQSKAQEEPGDDPGKKNNKGEGFLSQKISIPDTPEEIQKAAGEHKEKGDDNEEGSLKQDKGGEDVIIKEDSPLYLHAATLHEEGILPTLDLESLKGKPFKEGMQLFLDAQKKYIEDGRNEYLNSLTDRQKEFLEMIELGIPQEQVEHQFKIEDAYSKVTDEVLSDDTEMQKQIITQDLKLKGLSDTQVQRSIKASEENETLFEDAKESRDSINAYIADQKETQVQSAKTAQQDADKRDADLKKEIATTIEKMDEILPGIKISANEKTKLNELMTKPVEEKIINGRKTPINLINKKRMEDRVLFDLKLNYFINLGLFDAKADLTKLVKKVTSSAAEKLSVKLKEEAAISGKGVSFNKDEGEGSKNKSKIIFPQFM
jgi:hypothetical protein